MARAEGELNDIAIGGREGVRRVVEAWADLDLMSLGGGEREERGSGECVLHVYGRNLEE